MTKKVKAPLTYNPGKGRPKEHLAYLNYQEMQALKRLNGNNQERGPKGLPSFPPADAMGSSSKASSSKSSTKSSASKTSTKSSGADNKYSPRSGYRGTGSPTTGSIRGSAYGRFGGPADKQGGGDRGTKAPSGGRTGFSGGAKASADAKAKAEAASRDSVKIARESPAYKSDVKKGGISAIPSRSYSQVFDKQPGKIKGAIESVAEQAKKPSGVPSQASRIAREGPFGAPAYSGAYNPATGRYDAKPTAAQRVQSPVAMDPSIAGRLAQANKNYATVQSGPYVSRVYSDPDIKSPTFGETVSGYASRVADAVFGPDTQKYADQYSQSVTDLGNRFSNFLQGMTPNIPGPQKYQDQVTPTTPQRLYSGSYGPQLPTKQFYDRIAPTASPTMPRQFAEKVYGPAAQPRIYDQPSLNLAERSAEMERIAQEIKDIQSGKYDGSYGPQKPVRQSAEQTLRAYEAQKRAQPIPGVTETNIPGGDLPVQEKNTTVVGGPYTKGYDRALIAERVAKQRMAYDTPPATVDRLKAAFGAAEYDKKLNAANVKPMGYEQPSEKVLAAETVPEAGIAGLVGAEALDAVKKTNIPRLAYERPGFIEDVNQLGMGIPARDVVSATDMAKLHSRAYGEGYLTPAERRQAAVIGGIRKGIPAIAGMGTEQALKLFEKTRDIESPKDFLSRPSYEQAFLRDLARAENVRMGRDPLGRTSYTTADGEVVQGPAAGGGRGFGQGGDRGGIASLVAPTETVAPAPTESTTGTTQMGGPRPYIHFQWDLGLNIPKPTDPNYPDYQRYLANRAASAAAIEGA